MHNILQTKKGGVILLTLAGISILGIKASHAFEVHCPVYLDEKSRDSVMGGKEYAYHGDTTGDRRILVDTGSTNFPKYGDELKKDPYVFKGASNGAAGHITCSYQGAASSSMGRELHATGVSNNCLVIKPERGAITTENNYFECD